MCTSVLLLLHPEIIHAQNEQGLMLKKVVIDPGHGGRDPGSSGAKTKEKDIVLDISLRLGKMIQEKYPDMEVVYTRKKDEYLDPYKRGDIANSAHADLFISIHTNSIGDKKRCASVFGAETFVMGNNKSEANMESVMRENSVILLEEDYITRYEFDPNNSESYIIFSLTQNSFLNQSLDFAAEIQNQFKNSAQRVDRGVKQGPFYVLWKTAMPSVLIEVGFICNPEEEKFISSEAGKHQLASSIFQAFSSYKSKFEDLSLFLHGENTQNNDRFKTDSAPSKPQQATVQTKPAEPQSSKSETKKPKVEFCVQIGTSVKPMDTHPNNFKKHKNVERIQASANFYKYILGRTTDYAAAQATLKKVRADFKDAFVVSIVNGKIMSAEEGRKLITE